MMTRLICKILGIGFLALGLIGFFMPGLMGTHLSVAHNVIHIVSGLLAIWFGWKGSFSAAKTFSLTFGAVYGLLGMAGFFAGPGTPSMPGMEASDHLLRVIPGVLELGTMDSILHVIIGAAFLVAGLSPVPTTQVPSSDAKVGRETAGVK